MNHLGEQLCRCARSRAGRHTERRIVTFASKRDYNNCLASLRKAGITPIKHVPGSRMLCLHIRKQSDWRSIAAHPAVTYAGADRKVTMHRLVRPAGGKRRQYGTSSRAGNRPRVRASAAPGWNIVRVEAPQLWRRTNGNAVRVAIIDTGVGPHPALRIAGGVNTRGGSSYRDDNGHGTHVAGIAAARGSGLTGVAPGAVLYAVKALDRTGSGYVSDIVEGIDWCIRRGVRVINMSFGLPPGTHSEPLRAAVRRAYRRGIVMTASAGNEGTGASGLDEPAVYPETIAVAATTRTNRIAPYSSRGRGIAAAAPGSNIRSAAPGGGYRRTSGTSMAAPHAAGGAALLLALRPRLQPAEVKRLLRTGARPLGYAAAAQGAGLLQLAASAARRLRPSALRQSRLRLTRTGQSRPCGRRARAAARNDEKAQ